MGDFLARVAVSVSTGIRTTRTTRTISTRTKSIPQQARQLPLVKNVTKPDLTDAKNVKKKRESLRPPNSLLDTNEQSQSFSMQNPTLFLSKSVIALKNLRPLWKKLDMESISTKRQPAQQRELE